MANQLFFEKVAQNVAKPIMYVNNYHSADFVKKFTCIALTQKAKTMQITVRYKGQHCNV
jgi:hypothetical protein